MTETLFIEWVSAPFDMISVPHEVLNTIQVCVLRSPCACIDHHNTHALSFVGPIPAMPVGHPYRYLNILLPTVE